MNKRPHPLPSQSIAAIVLGSLLLASYGCKSPFHIDDEDYGEAPAGRRLRVINPLELRGAPPRPDEETEITAENVANRPSALEGLESVPLSIEDARLAGVANNLDLRASLLDPSIAQTRIGEEEAAFESAFTFRGSFTDSDQPTSNVTISSQAEVYQFEPGVEIPLLTGGRTTVSLPTSRVDSLNAFNSLNPSWETDLALSFSQPLLRNAGRRTTTHALRVAAFGDAISQAQTKLRVTETLARVNQAYWRLYQAQRTLEIRQTQFESARELLARAERLFNAGTVPEIEVLRAQSGVASSLDGIIRAEQRVLTDQRELKRLLDIEGLGVESDTRIDLTTAPDPIEYVFDEQALLGQAVANRAELYELELRLAIDESQVAFDRNQLKPVLDFFANYRINGLDDDYGEAVQNGLDRPIQDEWTLGINARVPLGNQLAESRFRRALLTRIQRVATKDAREQAIRQEVLDAVDALRASWQGLLAARQAVATTARQLAAERRRFEVGASTSTDVLDAVSQLAAEQATEVGALVSYQLAQIDLALSTGTLLGAERVVWEPAGLAADDDDQDAPGT